MRCRPWWTRVWIGLRALRRSALDRFDGFERFQVVEGVHRLLELPAAFSRALGSGLHAFAEALELPTLDLEHSSAESPGRGTLGVVPAIGSRSAALCLDLLGDLVS